VHCWSADIAPWDRVAAGTGADYCSGRGLDTCSDVLDAIPSGQRAPSPRCGDGQADEVGEDRTREVGSECAERGAFARRTKSPGCLFNAVVRRPA
jgi:hypothetical protein